MQRLSPCALAACLFALGCDPPTSGVAHASEWTQPHLAAFTRFDRWARRAATSDAVLQNRDALAETTFAPIRRDPAIASAWIRVEGPHPFVLALPPATALPAGDWIALRDPRLGAVRAARLLHCARVLAPASTPRDDGACVLIERREPAPPNGAITVTVAFRDQAEPNSGGADRREPNSGGADRREPNRAQSKPK